MTGNQPSGHSLLAHGEPLAEDVAELRSQLAQLQNRVDSDGLGWESEYRRELLREVRQRIELRQTAFLIAGVVMAVMTFFAWCALSYIADTTETAKSAGAASVGLFIAPIVSVSAITIMLVVGPFKRFKEEDKDHIQTPNIIIEGAKLAADKLG